MVAINTDYTKTSVSTHHTQKMLETISKIGFTHVHWVHQWNGTDIYSLLEMKQIKNWLQELNLQIKGIHATDGTISGQFDDRKVFISPNEFNREAGVELVKNRIDFASFLGANKIVLHVKMLHLILPKIGYESYEDTYWEQLFKSFDSIVKYGKEKKVKIAIENLEYPSLEIQFDQFDRLFERYSFDELGFCFDLGHNMILSNSKPFGFLERYQDRLTSLHLNCGLFNDSNETNYNKILKFDTHSVPNKDLVDFDILSKLIADSPYELPITFEIATSSNIEDTAIKTLDPDMTVDDLIVKNIEDALIETLKVGNEIDTLVRKHRNIE